MDNQNIELDIDVSGSINQVILLKSGFAMSQEEFIEKFKNGDIVTSIGHSDNNGKVYLLDGFKEIGHVLCQSSNDDMEISLYESVDFD